MGRFGILVGLLLLSGAAKAEPGEVWDTIVVDGQQVPDADAKVDCEAEPYLAGCQPTACDWSLATSERSACFVAFKGRWFEVPVGTVLHRRAMLASYAEPYVGAPTDLESAAEEASACDAEYESCYAETVAPGVWRAVQIDCDSTPNGWGCR